MAQGNMAVNSLPIRHKVVKDPKLFLLIVACFWMSVFDALATLNHVTNGIATESNPVMKYFLHLGTHTFFLVKAALTIAALTLFYRLRRWTLSRIGLGIALISYYGVMIYHILIYQLMYLD